MVELALALAFIVGLVLSILLDSHLSCLPAYLLDCEIPLAAFSFLA
jgi:hypothetical protein